MLDKDKININNSETRLLLAIFETLEKVSNKLNALEEINNGIKELINSKAKDKDSIKVIEEKIKKEVKKNGGSNARNKSKAAT